MVRLVDAAGNNVTDYRADQPWEVLISAAAEGGEDLIMAQPDLCTRATPDAPAHGKSTRQAQPKRWRPRDSITAARASVM